MVLGPHRIRRLRWSVRVDSSTAAFSLRQRLRAEWQDRFMPAIESAFNQAAPAEEIIRLPKVELRLIITSEKQLIEELPEMVQQQLIEQLTEILRQQPGTMRQARPEKSKPPYDPFQNLLQYLRTGSADWITAGVPAQDLAAHFKEICELKPGELRERLQSHPEPAPFYFRLLQLVPHSENLSWAQAACQGMAQPWKTPFLALLAWVLQTEQPWGRYLQLELAAHFLAEALAHRASESPPGLAALARRLLPNTFPPTTIPSSLLSASPSGLRQGDAAPPESASTPQGGAVPVPADSSHASPELSRESPAPSSFDARLQRVLPSPVAEPLNHFLALLPPAAAIFFRPEAHSIDPHNAVYSAHGPAAHNLNEEPPPEDLPLAPIRSPEYPSSETGQITGRSSPQASSQDEFPLLVSHAGLVLLHPFLPPLFENTRLLVSNQFVLSPSIPSSAAGADQSSLASLSSLPRAAALLYFLAEGLDEPYEYDLAFIKVLLGLNPGTAVCVASGLLSNDDQQEAGTVLESVIHYWTVLKNTSVAGLRSSFLNRSALLRNEANGWRLQVERLGFDVLLDHLPWSWSVIKLPWMSRPLYVEW